MRSKVFLVLLAIFILSCNKKTEGTTKVSNQDTLYNDISEEEESIEEEVHLNQLTFPKTGKTIEDFVLEPCEIKLKAEGFLNDDNLKDAVIVLQNKNDNTDIRATLVLLGEQTGGYKLQELSWEALDPEYTESGYHVYMSEEISIENKILQIMLQSGGGPPGTRETSYKYLNDKLVLVKIGTFQTGAGSMLSSEYDLVSGEVDHEVTNTMHDSMPGEHQIKKFKLDRQMLFAKDNPNTVLEKLPQADW